MLLCDGICRQVPSLVALFITLFTLATNPSFGQTLYGSLTGNVSDASGAAVPNAKIEALNIEKGTIKSATTDERGSYLMGDLLPGTYKVSITAPAFSSRVQEGVVITVNTVIRLDANLTVSQLNESVTVSAAAVTLQTDRADINNQIQSTQITNLPLINSQGRNFQILYKILPGFTPPVEAHSESGNPQRSMVTQANGMPQSTNNTKLDGATISHPWLPRLVAYLPPVESVETVNIVSNVFDAEQGMAGGAAMNVTIKSGTNEFHGAAWEFLTNSMLKARNYFYCLYSCTGDPNRAPKNVQNQYGAIMAGRSRRTSSSSSRTGNARRAARLLPRCAPCQRPRCGAVTFTPRAQRSSIRPPAMRMARAGRRLPSNRDPLVPHRQRRRRSCRS
ncbi:MAG: carboxypeptidase-like regulatory domain-containing protein [Paludibaculum sp.]